jgi:sialate O-acetylesterase
MSTTLFFRFYLKQLKPTAILIIFFFCHSLTYAQLRLPRIFSNDMILQREAAIPVWGTANAGIPIKVELGGKLIKTVAGKDGKWSLKLAAMKAGGPFTMSVFEGDKSTPEIMFKNVLIGDVWLASGQSNMEWQVQQSNNAQAEIRNANYPKIRFFQVPHKIQVLPQDTLPGGSWVIMDSAGVKNASAVAFFFAKDLHKDLNVPIGIVQSTWGGTPVEAWTSREALLTSAISGNKVISNDTIKPSHFIKDSLDLVRFWEIVYHPQNNMDITIPKNDYNDSQWSEVKMPVTLKDMNIPFYEGMVWLRKTISLPSYMKGKDLTIHLGQPEMNYSLYFNGKELAKTVWNASPVHSYKIPGNLVRQGENVISVRMAFLWQGGGFNPPAESMYITNGQDKINIAGTWKFKKDLEPVIPTIYNYHKYPTYLYNGMINPIVSYGIKGFIWYQGEDNATAPFNYQSLFPLLISDWRTRWKQGDLPFLYVQLANFMVRKAEPSESDWAALREAQTMTLNVPNTGMVNAIDLGEADNIHPKNKQEVGRRLALLANKVVYKKPLQAYGPIFKRFSIRGDQMRIQFTETGAGLSIKGDGPLKGFAVAGSDKKFYWANAKIDGNSVIVQSDKVKVPVAVRYAWADNPECNLTNKEGLPAIPFRTDNKRSLQ